MSFWWHQIDQKTNGIFVRISALASKKRSNKKSRVKNVKIKVSFFLDLTFLKRLGQKSLQKFRWVFGRFGNTTNGYFRSNWPFQIQLGTLYSTIRANLTNFFYKNYKMNPFFPYLFPWCRVDYWGFEVRVWQVFILLPLFLKWKRRGSYSWGPRAGGSSKNLCGQ